MNDMGLCAQLKHLGEALCGDTEIPEPRSVEVVFRWKSAHASIWLGDEELRRLCQGDNDAAYAELKAADFREALRRGKQILEKAISAASNVEKDERT